jgi:hypothetical protein
MMVADIIYKLFIFPMGGGAATLNPIGIFILWKT